MSGGVTVDGKRQAGIITVDGEIAESGGPAGNVTTSDTLVNNFLVRGNGGVDVDIAGDGTSGVLIDTVAQDLTILAAPNSFVSFSLTDSGLADRLEVAFDDSTNSASIQSNSPLRIFSPTGEDITLEGALIKSSDESTQEFAATPGRILGRLVTARKVQSLDISAQDTLSLAVFMRDDGLKVYITGSQNDSVYEYDLSVSFDLSTAVFNQALSVVAQGALPSGIFFKPGGTVMYTCTSSGDDVNQYLLGTPWDISTAVFDTSFSASAQDAFVNGIHFHPQGLRVYVVGGTNDAVFEYTLTTPWDVTGGTFSGNSFSVSAQTSAAHSVAMRGDGLYMYVVSGNGTLFEYALRVPWDITTATLSQSIVSGLGQTRGLSIDSRNHKMYLVSQFSDTIIEYDLGIQTAGTLISGTVQADTATVDVVEYGDASTQIAGALPTLFEGRIATAAEIGSFDVSAQDTTPHALFLRSDGLKLYVAGNTNDTVYEYDLGTPWDVTSASFVGSFLPGAGITEPSGITFKPDGREMYLVGDSLQVVRQYTLSTPWDITTASSFVASLGVVAQDAGPEGIHFHPEGLSFYIAGDVSNAVFRYDLQVPWDLSTAEYSGVSFSVNVAVLKPGGLSFRGDGVRMYVLEDGASGDIIVEYELSTPWDITTSVQTGIIDVRAGARGLYISPYSHRLYHADEVPPAAVFELTLGLETEGKSVFGSVDTGFVSLDSAEYTDGSSQDTAATPTTTLGRVSTISELSALNILAQDFVPQALWVREDKRKMYFVGSTNFSVYEYDLPTSGLFSGASFVASFVLTGASPVGLHFARDGLTMYTLGTSTDDVDQYSLSTAWDVTTASLATSFNVSAQDGTPHGLYFHPSGESFYIAGTITDTVYRYDMRVPFDVSTAVHNGNFFDVSGQVTFPSGLAFRRDGRFMYVSDGTASTVNLIEYQLTTPWDLTTAVLSGTADIRSGVRGLYADPLADRLYYSNLTTTSLFDLSTGVEADRAVFNSANVDGEEVMTAPPEVVQVSTAAELEALATGGVITVTTSLTIQFMAPVESATEFLVLGGALTLSGAVGGIGANYTYSGTGTFLSGAGLINISSLDLLSSSTGTCFGFAGGLMAWVSGGIDGWDDEGFIAEAFVNLSGVVHLNIVSGLSFINTSFIMSGNGLNGVPTGGGAMFTISGDIDTVSSVSGMGGFALDDIFSIDPAITDASRITVIGSTVSGLGDLFETGGTAGTFTVVADASVASTTINSVSLGTGGAARFNFTVGPTLFVGQTITNVGYVTNTAYNATRRITATGAGFFETGILFGADELGGSFTSDSVTLTDTSPPSNGDTLVIDTTGSTDYDGGAVVFNVVAATSFQISRPFTATAAGTWSTAKLDHTDARIFSATNRNFASSRSIGAAFANNLATATTGIVNNTFQDIVFGTGGTHLVAGSSMERFKLIDETNGTFEYTGAEPFSGDITSDYSVVSSGGAQEFRFKWLIDIGAGFVNLPDNVESLAEVGATAASVTKHQPVELTTGDQIKPQLTRNAGASDITMQYVSINTFQ